jgi:two-component system cell cycle response regulator CtrA
MMRVMFIEPAEMVAAALAKKLRAARIAFDRVTSVDEAVQMSKDDLSRYSGVLLGSVEDAVADTASLRATGVEVPLVVLSDVKASDLAIGVFGAGADDFVVKPFNPLELKARLHAVTRRLDGRRESASVLGPLTVYEDGRDPEVDGKPVKLSQREHAIFHYLARHRGRVVSKEAVYTAVYGAIDAEPFDKVIDVYICKLRKKLAEATGGAHFIETVYCRGYKLDEPANIMVQRLGGGGRRAAA